MKRLVSLFLTLIVLVSTASPVDNSVRKNHNDGFVRTDGTQLTLDGKPYRFIGTNLWYAPILASKGQGGDRERLRRELDELQSMNVNNLRILVGSDGLRGEKTKVEPTLQVAPGVYNDTILDGLDYLMAELQRRNMKAVLYLNNSWEWSGGYKFYVDEVARKNNKKPLPLSADVPWNEYCKEYSRFSTDTAAQNIFYDYVRFIVGRTNRYTGKPYNEDPSIISWQIGNEPRAFSKDAIPGFERWLTETAQIIRNEDPNHLISIGSEGIVGCEGDEQLYRRICSNPDIDFLNLHLWPTNWGWASKTIEPGDVENSIFNSLRYINRHCEIARQLDKPLVLEEFGYPREGGSKDLKSGVTSRDRFYSFILEQLFKAVEEGSPLVGVNFWGWGGEGRPAHDAWHPGDDFTCDPAHEPQGLYSVFNCDSTTVSLIKNATRRLDSLQICAIPWRGIHVDVSRHFMPFSFLKKEIDAMKYAGLNRMHLHLTDGPGWRMEIKSRPLLTEIGAWRTDSLLDDWWNGSRKFADATNGYGGYYTQDQLRELVIYAAEKGIDIMPEIEFPAHSEAAIAAYPETGFNNAEFDMQKESTYALMRDVLEEVADVFPSPFLHVGGDEAATQHEIQPSAMRRIKNIVDSLGRRMVVWDEALTDEPCDSDIVIMVWRNPATAIEAAALGHDVVLCPGKYCYFDKAQDAPLTQPRGAGGYLPVDSVYAIPDAFGAVSDSGHLLGIQGNIWTEYVPTPQHAEYMLWPRAYAISELGRHGLSAPRDPEGFHARAIKVSDYLRDTLGINAFDLRNEAGERSYEMPAGTISREADGKYPKVTYITEAHRAYPGHGNITLVDGEIGGWNNTDGRWQGFLGSKGMEIIIDLGKKKQLSGLEGDFMQSCGPEIFFPYTLEIQISDDCKKFKPLFSREYADIYAVKHQDYQRLGWKGSCKARYIRIKALPGPKRGWVFSSEILVTEKK